MKVTYSVILLLAVLGIAFSKPAKKEVEQSTEKEPNKDVDFVPLGNKQFGFPPDGVIDVDAGSFFGRTPFTSAFDSFEASFVRMRQLIDRLLGRVDTDSVGVPDFPAIHIPNLGDVDLGKGNTTSVTKIINGHKVTINDTEYKSDEANGSSFFKVHIVEVHPDSEAIPENKDVESTVPPKRDPESIEETNEIPKVNEDVNFDENIETLEQADLAPPQKLINQQWNKDIGVENFEDNRIDVAPQKPYDLSNDIYVNQLLADSGAKTNPDAEVFDSINGRLPTYQHYPEARASASRAVPFSYYPVNRYNQPNIQQMPPYENAQFYAPPVAHANDPYYNRFQPEEVVIVPLANDPQSYYVPLAAQSDIPTQSANLNTEIISSTSTKSAPNRTKHTPTTT